MFLPLDADAPQAEAFGLPVGLGAVSIGAVMARMEYSSLSGHAIELELRILLESQGRLKVPEEHPCPRNGTGEGGEVVGSRVWHAAARGSRHFPKIVVLDPRPAT